MSKENRNRFGLTERDMETILGIFKKHPDIKQVKIFGSRAKGNYHIGSDIDLAIVNPGLQTDTLRQLAVDFEESALPYKADIIHIPAITHPELLDHIQRVGIVIYDTITSSETVLK